MERGTKWTYKLQLTTSSMQLNNTDQTRLLRPHSPGRTGPSPYDGGMGALARCSAVDMDGYRTLLDQSPHDCLSGVTWGMGASGLGSRETFNHS